MMAVLTWIIFGFVVGLIARALMPGRQDFGILMTVLLGIVGSVVGGLISWTFRGVPSGGFDTAGIIMSIIGAVIALAIYGAVTKRQRVT